MQLPEMRDRLLALPALQKRAYVIGNEIAQAQMDVNMLLDRCRKESRDVDRIQGETISAFMYRLIGRYEEKLEKEQQEEINAKLNYDRAVTHLANLQNEERELNLRIAALNTENSVFHTQLESIKKQRANNGQFESIEQERRAIVSQMTEIEEALHAVDRTRDTARKIHKSLSSAEGWATFDAFLRGGIISHIAKYSHVDNAERDMHTLSSQLRELRQELDDVDGLFIPQLNEISAGQRTIDMWFDNIFTDLSVRRKIMDNADEVEHLIYSLDAAESSLVSKLREQEKAFEDNKRKEEEFLLSSI